MQKKSIPKQVRIIGGLWKRTPLAVIDGPGLRPTPDRVRETVFNWLDFLLQRNWQMKRCLDLFAGSGALGFEAASRGAAQVTLVEKHPGAIEQLKMIQAKLGAQQVKILQGDAKNMTQQLATKKEQFDVIFLDPPFHHDILTTILSVCVPLLRDDGYVYVEAEKAFEHPNWQVIRSDRAGQVFFHLLRRNQA